MGNFSSRFLLEKRDKIFWVLTIALHVLWVIIVFATLSDAQVRVYFNSDTLYLPSIFKDLFIDGGTIEGWHLNAAPNFFPDMFLYFVCNFIAKDFRLAMLILSIGQYAILLFLMGYTLRLAVKGVSYWDISFGSFFLLLIVLVTPGVNDFTFTFYILSISYHLGPFLFTFLNLILVYRYLSNRKLRTLLFLFIVSLLASLSNKLFFVMFLFPLIGSLFLLTGELPWKHRLSLAATALLGCTSGLLAMGGLGRWLGVSFMGAQWKMFNFSNVFKALNVLSSQLGRYLQLMDLRGIIVLLSGISFALFCFFAIQILLHRKKRIAVDISEELFFYFSIFFLLLVLLTPIINGSYVGWASLRYNVHVFYFALFNFGYIVYWIRRTFLSNNYSHWVSMALFLLFTIFAFTQLVSNDIHQGINRLVNYYPPDVECVDRFGSANGMKYGVANYWMAKKTTMFSKNEMRLYTVHSNGSAWYHVMNEKWYYNKDSDYSLSPKFEFVVVNGLDTLEIFRMIGEPIERYLCKEASETILIFPEFIFDGVSRKPYPKVGLEMGNEL